MYTKNEIFRSIDLLSTAADIINTTDTSEHGTFSLCAYEQKLKIYPSAERPVDSKEIVKISKFEITMGVQCTKWNRIIQVLRDFVAEKILV